ncbi:DUF771 domain-containing protein [Bacillus sp. TL12]|uniref:DUF771 domain-containing protein n=1 Tax=Bacillus sp. TL12 TaxID=2894756 RepID=UPI001F51D14D|nr:DUF771 domain-containing protein [Bacillus sp. TL12]MCI0766157.1 DUF771 domain-containing protein [Bacillus sp. TL12]
MDGTAVVNVAIDEEYVRNLAEQKVQSILEGMGIGTWWNMERLKLETNRKYDWIAENILFNPRFQNEMKEISNNKSSGRWMFKAKEMREFLEQNFHYLNGRGNNQ